jgi:hypothetical protein
MDGHRDKKKLPSIREFFINLSVPLVLKDKFRFFTGTMLSR